MSHHVFCDGLQDVSIVSGLVRLDYVHHVPGAPGPDGKPRKEHALRVCMSPEAFVQSYAVLERVMQELASRGLVTRRSAADAAPAAGDAGAATAAPPPSANF